jgi:muramoyltetrapeptide carboxypeptidase
VAWLKKQGYVPVLGENVHRRHRYLAGTDRERAADFQAAVADPSIAGVICARGGYGSARILNHLDVSVFRKNFKFFCGFSDVTVLHLWLNDECGWITWHGPMVGTKYAGDGFDPASERSLLDALRGQPATIEAAEAITLHPGTVRGRLVGGNLSLLCHSIGTHYEPETDGVILLIEDVHEAPYRIDRMLTHLRQAGKLMGVRAVVVGEMLDCDAPRGADFTVDDVVADCLADLPIPVVTHFPISHGTPNYTVALGLEYELDAEARRLAPVLE